jgi:hypothetical protein
MAMAELTVGLGGIGSALKTNVFASNAICH